MDKHYVMEDEIDCVQDNRIYFGDDLEVNLDVTVEGRCFEVRGQGERVATRQDVIAKAVRVHGNRHAFRLPVEGLA